MSPLRLSVLLAALALASCVPGGAGTRPAPRPTPRVTISRDINKLGRVIGLPRRPLSAVWQQKQIGDGNFGPSDYTIKAAMQFSSRDLRAITASAMKRSKPKPSTIAVEPWFPQALKQMTQSKNGLRAQKLDASDFTKMSFLQGELWRIEGTDYLFVSLFTN